MKAVRVHEYGLASPMRVDKVEDPAPAPGELLVKAAAAGVNPVDLIIRLGGRTDETHLPYIPGHNTSGEVAAVGEGVTEFRVGQRIYGLAYESYAELVRIDAAMAAELPKTYSYDEGAGITSAFFTAWNALVFKAAAGAGEPHSRIVIDILCELLLLHECHIGHARISQETVPELGPGQASTENEHDADRDEIQELASQG